MATEILAIGTGAANSADVTIAAGAQLTVGLKDAAGPSVSGRVQILIKDDAGQYFDVGELSGRPVVIAGAGTYRFTRVADGATCGVFSG